MPPHPWLWMFISSSRSSCHPLRNPCLPESSLPIARESQIPTAQFAAFFRRPPMSTYLGLR